MAAGGMGTPMMQPKFSSILTHDSKLQARMFAALKSPCQIDTKPVQAPRCGDLVNKHVGHGRTCNRIASPPKMLPERALLSNLYTSNCVIMLVNIFNLRIMTYMASNNAKPIGVRKMYKSGEIYEVMADFEKVATGRVDKEPKDLWVKGQWYQNGEINKLFDMYLKGYAAGKCYQRLAG